MQLVKLHGSFRHHFVRSFEFDCALVMRKIDHEWQAGAPMYIEGPAKALPSGGTL